MPTSQECRGIQEWIARGSVSTLLLFPDPNSHRDEWDSRNRLQHVERGPRTKNKPAYTAKYVQGRAFVPRPTLPQHSRARGVGAWQRCTIHQVRLYVDIEDIRAAGFAVPMGVPLPASELDLVEAQGVHVTA